MHPKTVGKGKIQKNKKQKIGEDKRKKHVALGLGKGQMIPAVILFVS